MHGMPFSDMEGLVVCHKEIRKKKKRKKGVEEENGRKRKKKKKKREEKKRKKEENGMNSLLKQRIKDGVGTF